ncbi:MAG: hypothetical protein HYZ53_26780 [Planctomycetes bacterium]|nr:hypothetical protein [Planctomycetota bacterium]
MSTRTVRSAGAGLAVLFVALFAPAAAAAEGQPRNAAAEYRKGIALLKLPAAERTQLRAWLTADVPPPPEASGFVDRNAEALACFRRAAATAECDFQLDYVLGLALPSEHVLPGGDLANLACLRARLALAARGWDDAADDLESALRFVRHLGRDRTEVATTGQIDVAVKCALAVTLAFARELPPVVFCERLEAALRELRIDAAACLPYEIWCARRTVKLVERNFGERLASAGFKSLAPVVGPLGTVRKLPPEQAREVAQATGLPETRVARVESWRDLKECILEGAAEHEAWLAALPAAWKLPRPQAWAEIRRLAQAKQAASLLLRTFPPLEVNRLWGFEQTANARLVLARVLVGLGRRAHGGAALPTTRPALQQAVVGLSPYESELLEETEFAVDAWGLRMQWRPAWLADADREFRAPGLGKGPEPWGLMPGLAALYAAGLVAAALGWRRARGRATPARARLTAAVAMLGATGAVLALLPGVLFALLPFAPRQGLLAALVLVPYGAAHGGAAVWARRGGKGGRVAGYALAGLNLLFGLLLLPDVVRFRPAMSWAGNALFTVLWLGGAAATLVLLRRSVDAPTASGNHLRPSPAATAPRVRPAPTPAPQGAPGKPAGRRPPGRRPPN